MVAICKPSLQNVSQLSTRLKAKTTDLAISCTHVFHVHVPLPYQDQNGVINLLFLKIQPCALDVFEKVNIFCILTEPVNFTSYALISICMLSF